jgi:hypothetical protein
MSAVRRIIRRTFRTSLAITLVTSPFIVSQSVAAYQRLQRHHGLIRADNPNPIEFGRRIELEGRTDLETRTNLERRTELETRTELERRIRIIMADPNLDEAQKYRISERCSAETDLNIAFYASEQNAKKMSAASECVRELDAVSRGRYYRSTIAGLLQEHLALEREFSSQFWRTSKLFLFAPWGDVAFLERIVTVSGMITMNGLVLPLTRSTAWTWHRSLTS